MCGSVNIRGKFDGMQRTCGSSSVAFRSWMVCSAHGWKGSPPGTTLFRSAVYCEIGFFSRHSPLSSVSNLGQGSASAIVHIQERSGFPFAARGGGAARLGLPFLVLGTPAVG